jgi:putative endopeptidase
MRSLKQEYSRLLNLYSTFTVLGDLHINGALTVGENTADIAGIAVAYDAFKMTEEGKGTKIDGFTPDQRLLAKKYGE